MRRTYFVIAWITLSIGCGDGDGGSANDGGRRMDAGGDASASSCLEVLACVGACATDACIDACLASATPEAATQITALVSCNVAAGCGDDDGCIEANCAEALAACQGVVLGDGGVVLTDAGQDASTTMPSRIVGTSRDHITFPGSTFTVDSNATLTFVRDDAAGVAAGVPDTFAFYRLQNVTYRAVAGGVNGICEMSADFTETFTNPPAFENHIMVERAAGTDGLYAYAVTTTLTVNHPMGMMVTCPPPIPSTPGEFNAEHNLTTGTSTPRSDGMTFVGTTMIGTRTFSWDLHAED